MHKNQSIFEDSEQQFSRPLDNEYARFDINSIQKAQRRSDEEYDYDYQKDSGKYSVQVSTRSQQDRFTVNNGNQLNGQKQHEPQISEIDFEESDYHQFSSNMQKDQQHQDSQQSNFTEQPAKKEEVNWHFKNYIAYLKQKNGQSESGYNNEQRMQNPSSSVQQENGHDQYIKSISISPISNSSPQKSDSFNQSNQSEDHQNNQNNRDEEEATSEISQIQKYIKSKHEKQQNNFTKQLPYFKEQSRDEIQEDNLDYAEMVIKVKQQPPKNRHLIEVDNPIKKVLISQFQDEKQEENNSQQLFIPLNQVEDEGEHYPPSQMISKEEAMKKAEDISLSDYIPKQAIRLSLENQKKILFQGELQKYKPGLNYNFISRYITLSMESLKYYKDRVNSKCYEDKPLYVLPISCIQSVSRVSFSVPLLPKELQRQKKNLQKMFPDNLQKNVVVYYFEIIIDNSSLEICKAENDSSIGNRYHNNHLMPQDKLDSQRNGQLNKKIKDLTTWSGRSHEWYESEKRLLFCTQDKTILETWVRVLNWIISLQRDQQISSYSHIYSTERIS